ncbi:hypothetical protein O3M35_006702 [Rhynocoris fuscipes]|uniref:Uncharacterized protein n=1 Tax=Rhynocoris fuscipes TaxID=488301 RepID=A0AAW1DM33_9HEMI
MDVRNVQPLEHAFYRFKNCSQCKVYVYWKSPTSFVFYNCLTPGQFLDVNSYESHVWLFLNGDNGSRLWGEGRYEFYSKGWRKELLVAKRVGFLDESHNVPFRRLIKITYPLYNLACLSMEVVRDTNIKLEDVDDLEIPVTLKYDLRLMISIKNCIQSHSRECQNNCLYKSFRCAFAPLWRNH